MTTQRDPLFRLDRSTIVREEDIDRLLTESSDEMTQLAEQHAAATRADYLQQVTSGEPQVLPPSAHSSLDELASGMRAYLEDHVVVLDEPGSDVNASELERALIRQALVRLRAPALQQIIRQKGGLPIGNAAAELARQVADSYGWDPAAVARLVLDHTEEPQVTADGWSTRIFEMLEPVGVDRTESLLVVALRRFVSVGPVRWFVFDVMERSELRISVKGRLRTFTPKANETADGETAVLGSESETYDATVVAEEGSRIITVEQAKTTTAARAAASAFAKLTLANRQTWVSSAERDAPPVPERLHPQTQLILGIVRSRLPRDLFSAKNAILARFRIAVGTDKNIDSDTATISAWRAEGRHLLNTPSASKLMLSEGRPLVDLTFDALIAGSAEGTVKIRCATRIVLDSDHVLVETGLAGASQEETHATHRAAVEAVKDALQRGIPTEVVARLVEDIRRNESGESSAGPSILDESEGVATD